MNIIKMKKAALLLMAGMMLVLSAGCDPQTQQGSSSTSSVSSSSSSSGSSSSASAKKPSAPAPDNQKQQEVKKMTIEVYYSNEDGTKLIGVTREIEVNPYKDKYTAAVEMQMRAPKEKELIDIFPKSAKLRSVKVQGETAIVDFDSSTAKGFVGGSTGEEMLVGSVVNTLTNFPEIKEVRFLLDGKEMETLAGHMDLSMPIKRMSGLLK